MAALPLRDFLIYFAETITLKVEETYQNYHGYVDSLDTRPSPLLAVTEAKMFVFWY
jgi:hypothetical protein